MEIEERPTKIKIPKALKSVNIFADCETFIDIDPLYFKGPEDYQDRDYRDKLFRDFGTVVPWLLCFDVPRVGYDKNGKALLLNGRKTGFTLFPHENFFKLLKQIYDSGHLPLIWFHNTTYDITAIYPTALKEMDPDAEIYFHVKDSNNDFISGTIYSPKFGFYAQLADTMKYKKISLGKVGEMFEFPKGSVVYNLINLEIFNGVGYYINWQTGEPESFLVNDYINYCSRDVELLAKYYDYITRFKVELYHAVLGEGKNVEQIKRIATVGEQAKNMFDCFLYRHLRANFDNYFRPNVKKLEYYRQYKSNNGGFTSMNAKYPFYRCTDKEQIFYIDINGSYSYVMSQGLPYGDLLSSQPKGDYVVWVRVQINAFRWIGLLEDLTTMGIGMDRIKHLDKPTYTDENDWYTEKEIYIPENVWEWLKENAEITYKYRGKFYQKITHIARKYMKFLNEVRKKYKEIAAKDTDKMERQLADEIQKNIKTAANSNYGKFCQKTYIKERFYLGDCFGDYSKEEEEITYKGTLTGAFVTWMGRFKLYKKLLEIRKAGFTFLYCDTDSIIGVYDLDKSDLLKSIVGVNTNELGQWKIEGYYKEFAYLVRKKYMLIDYEDPAESKFVFSGLDKLDRWIAAFKVGLLNEFDETLTLLRDLFDHSQNWVLKDGKKVGIRTAKYAQTIIKQSDFNTNRAIKKVSGYIWLEGEGYGYQKTS